MKIARASKFRRLHTASLVVGALALGAVAAWTASSFAHDTGSATEVEGNLEAIGSRLLLPPESFLSGPPAVNEDGFVNVVVEIPAGTNAKWQVRKPDGALEWELKDGMPRVVQYLAYPANYGMIPRTMLSKERGGDGDPLDVVLLGPAEPRGTVTSARIVGVLRMRDNGEQDDKLVAVSPESVFKDVESISQLKKSFPGVVEILTLWFENYKGPGEIDVHGKGSAEEAKRILADARRAYAETVQ